MKRLMTITALLALACFSAKADLPFRIHRYSALEAAPIPHGKIVMIGDSITNMHEWWEAFGGSDDILNRGVSGALSSETLAHIGPIVESRPAKAFLMVGVNDIRGGISASTFDNIRKIAERFRTESPETELYMQSLLPTAAEANVPYILEINSKIKAYCDTTAATYVDIWSLLKEEDSCLIRPELTLDGLHPSMTAYRIWCNEISKYIGKECIYPKDAENSFCGLERSFGMRASTLTTYPVGTGDTIILGDETVHAGEWHELLGPAYKDRGTGWGIGMNSVECARKMVPGILGEGKTPARVVIQCGIGDIVIGKPVAEIAAAYDSLVVEVMTATPESKVSLMEVLPLPGKEVNEEKISVLNEAIRKIAAERGAEFLGTWDRLYDSAKGVADSRYFLGQYPSGEAYRVLADIIAGSPEGYVLSTRRDVSFSGRGNCGETLTTLTVNPSRPLKAGKVKVALCSDRRVADRLHVSVGGTEVASAKIRCWKKTYRFNLGSMVSTPSDVTVSADIKADAAEGSKITADIASIRLDGRTVKVCKAAEGAREVLLARTCLFRPGDYGSKNYRIPALCTLPDGSLLTATDKRKFNEIDLPHDIDIVARRSTDGGHTWSEPVTIIEGKGYGKGYGDAILAVAQDGTIVCGFCGGAGLWRSTLENPQKNWIALSKDNGQTWSEPIDITAMQWGPEAKNPECRTSHSAFFGSGHGLVLSKGPHAGRIMFVTAIATKDNRLDNYAMWSDDNGQTWDISTLAYAGGDEAKVVELNDGRILMSIRQNGRRGWNISEDGGETWGEQARWDDIVTNACDGDIIRYDDNLLLHSLPNSMRREDVSIFMSTDEGKTWPASKKICDYESLYSSLTVLPDGTIGAYIEEAPTGECEMWFMNFSLDWLKK